MVLWLPGAMAGLCPDGCVWDQASRLRVIKMAGGMTFPSERLVSWPVQQTDFC